jgi:hypothetical protein
MAPARIVCADWSADHRRREVYIAHVSTRAIGRLSPPSGGWTVRTLVQAASTEPPDGSTLVGIDVPLGVPASLADALGLAAGATFLDLLGHVAAIPGFFESCLKAVR